MYFQARPLAKLFSVAALSATLPLAWAGGPIPTIKITSPQDVKLYVEAVCMVDDAFYDTVLTQAKKSFEENHLQYPPSDQSLFVEFKGAPVINDASIINGVKSTTPIAYEIDFKLNGVLSAVHLAALLSPTAPLNQRFPLLVSEVNPKGTIEYNERDEKKSFLQTTFDSADNAVQGLIFKATDGSLLDEIDQKKSSQNSAFAECIRKVYSFAEVTSAINTAAPIAQDVHHASNNPLLTAFQQSLDDLSQKTNVDATRVHETKQNRDRALLRREVTDTIVPESIKEVSEFGSQLEQLHHLLEKLVKSLVCPQDAKMRPLMPKPTQDRTRLCFANPK